VHLSFIINLLLWISAIFCLLAQSADTPKIRIFSCKHLHISLEFALYVIDFSSPTFGISRAFTPADFKSLQSVGFQHFRLCAETHAIGKGNDGLDWVCPW